MGELIILAVCSAVVGLSLVLGTWAPAVLLGLYVLCIIAGNSQRGSW